MQWGFPVWPHIRIERRKLSDNVACYLSGCKNFVYDVIHTRRSKKSVTSQRDPLQSFRISSTNDRCSNRGSTVSFSSGNAHRNRLSERHSPNRTDRRKNTIFQCNRRIQCGKSLNAELRVLIDFTDVRRSWRRRLSLYEAHCSTTWATRIRFYGPICDPVRFCQNMARAVIVANESTSDRSMAWAVSRFDLECFYCSCRWTSWIKSDRNGCSRFIGMRVQIGTELFTFGYRARRQWPEATQ